MVTSLAQRIPEVPGIRWCERCAARANSRLTAVLRSLHIQRHRQAKSLIAHAPTALHANGEKRCPVLAHLELQVLRHRQQLRRHGLRVDARIPARAYTSINLGKPQCVGRALRSSCSMTYNEPLLQAYLP